MGVVDECNVFGSVGNVQKGIFGKVNVVLCKLERERKGGRGEFSRGYYDNGYFVQNLIMDLIQGFSQNLEFLVLRG